MKQPELPAEVGDRGLAAGPGNGGDGGGLRLIEPGRHSGQGTARVGIGNQRHAVGRVLGQARCLGRQDRAGTLGHGLGDETPSVRVAAG